jgi:hypothetical protein
MVDSDIFGAYISRNSARVIFLSFLTPCKIDRGYRRVNIHGLPLGGMFSRDWRSVAQATQLRTVDYSRHVIRLIAAKEYHK